MSTYCFNFQTKQIIKICNSLPINVCDNGLNGTDLHRDAIMICGKFKHLFSKYAVCHKLINQSKKIGEEDYTNLGKIFSTLFLFENNFRPNQK